MGVRCEVIAPTLIPRKPGDKVKTDRRDAEKLACYYRRGDLVAVWVPDKAHEALRDLVRARESAKADQIRARHRLSKLLLRQGIRAPEGMKIWGRPHETWLRTLRFEEPALEAVRIDHIAQVQHQGQRIEQLEKAIDEAIEKAPNKMKAVIEALQAMRGIQRLTAATIVSELGELSRFDSPRQLMGYAGLVPREHSSGGSIYRGSITKTGNAHLRRVVIESVWSYRHPPSLYPLLRKRQIGLSEETKSIAWKAQQRLHTRYRRLTGRGKHHGQVVTALGREMLGFMWAIATRVERQHETQAPKAKRVAA
jgi:transposase